MYWEARGIAAGDDDDALLLKIDEPPGNDSEPLVFMEDDDYEMLPIVIRSWYGRKRIASTVAS